MAHSLANTGDKDGVPMSEGVEVEDAADRAERKRNYGTVRVPANKIGFWPGNRGRTGINSIHVHEIARDIMFRKRSRYEPVQLLEVPEALMKPFKAQNKEKCDSDPLMPAFSPDMEYVSVSTTHFLMPVSWSSMAPTPCLTNLDCRKFASTRMMQRAKK